MSVVLLAHFNYYGPYRNPKSCPIIGKNARREFQEILSTRSKWPEKGRNFTELHVLGTFIMRRCHRFPLNSYGPQNTNDLYRGKCHIHNNLHATPATCKMRAPVERCYKNRYLQQTENTDNVNGPDPAQFGVPLAV